MTDRYAVIGHPVAHSLSPAIHQAFARQTGESLSYEKIEAPLDDFIGTVREFFASGARGCNVTVPFKGEAAAWAHRLHPDAAQADAVNTLVLTSSGEIVGYNTDGVGLVADLERRLGEKRADLRVLLVGAGGAARGVAGPLLKRLAGSLVVANRTPERAEALVDGLRSIGERRAAACALQDVKGPFDLVINATAAGLYDQAPDLPASVYPGALCYDLVYGGETPFCRAAAAAGARQVADGLGMLVWQAAYAFELWRGRLPDAEAVLAELRTGALP